MLIGHTQVRHPFREVPRRRKGIYKSNALIQEGRRGAGRIWLCYQMLLCFFFLLPPPFSSPSFLNRIGGVCTQTGKTSLRPQMLWVAFHPPPPPPTEAAAAAAATQLFFCHFPPPPNPRKEEGFLVSRHIWGGWMEEGKEAVCVCVRMARKEEFHPLLAGERERWEERAQTHSSSSSFFFYSERTPLSSSLRPSLPPSTHPPPVFGLSRAWAGLWDRAILAAAAAAWSRLFFLQIRGAQLSCFGVRGGEIKGPVLLLPPSHPASLLGVNERRCGYWCQLEEEVEQEEPFTYFSLLACGGMCSGENFLSLSLSKWGRKMCLWVHRVHDEEFSKSWLTPILWSVLRGENFLQKMWKHQPHRLRETAP